MATAKPIIIAHHLIWTAYGWWLPNDPRGSSSHTIRNDIIADLGELHHGRKNVQPVGPTIRKFYEEAAAKLQHSLLTFDRQSVNTIAAAFSEVIERQRYTCYACAIMFDHAHLLIRKHKHTAEQMIEHFQASSRLRLRDANLRPANHPAWGGPGWKVFLDHPDQVRRTIGYVEDNPIKMRQPRQTWNFVKRYDNWPLHPGHSPMSPYVKRLKAAGRCP